MAPRTWLKQHSGAARAFYAPPAVWLLAFLLAVFVLPPFIFIGVDSVSSVNADGSTTFPTLSNYGNIFESVRFYRNLQNSFAYSIGSAVLALALGLLQAWIVERTDTPGRRIMYLVAVLSLAVPSVLYTISWLLVFGKAGPVNDILQSLFGGTGPYINIYTLPGMIVIEGLAWAPLAFLLMSSTFKNFDPSLEEAASMSGASRLATFKRIVVRLALPAISALTILIIVRSLESFEVPALVGIPGDVYVISTNIYEAVSLKFPPQYGAASAFSIILLMLVVVLLTFQSRLAKSGEKYRTVSGKAFRPRTTELGKWRYLTGASLIVLFFLLLVTPIGMLSFVATQAFYSDISWDALTSASLENFEAVLARADVRSAVGNTVLLGVLTATIVTILTAICAWLVVRRARAAQLLDVLATLPLGFPAIVLGVAYLILFLYAPLHLNGSLIALVIAYSVSYLPYGMRYCYVAVLQIDTSLEEAAQSSGAGKSAVFLRIILPLIRPGLLACWLFIFLVSARGVTLAIMLSGPTSQVVASALFDLWQNGQTPQLAAMGVLWMGFMSAVCGAFLMISRKSQVLVG